jgi:hypothetical protein
MTLETLVTLWSKATKEQKQAIGSAVESCLNGKVKDSQPIPRLLSRSEVAKIIGRTPQRVDQLCRMGILPRVYAAGTSRAIGIPEGAVRDLVLNKAQEGQS